jgi:hypothetical protein
MRDPAWITEAFRWCVEVLRVAAAHLGITYEAINIYLFVIIWPLLSVASVVLHVRQWRELRRWRAAFPGTEPGPGGRHRR